VKWTAATSCWSTTSPRRPATLTAAAKILKDHGAKSIRAAVSHCVLNEIAYERLKGGLIDELITTNSVPIETRGLPINRP